MSDITDLLNDFIAILKDGLLLYEDAVTRITDFETRQHFETMVTLRKKAILELAPFVREEGEQVRVVGTVLGTLRQEYADLAAMIGDPNKIYHTELVALEERTLKALRESITSMPAGEARAALEDQLAGLKGAYIDLANSNG